ncbi:MAG: portal protein [Plesiomonas shigelloides]
MASKQEELDNLHEKALRRFDAAYFNSQEQRQYVTEQRRFVDVPGAQWEGSTNAGFSFDGDRFDKYPRFELNKIARECYRIISEYRNNRISVRFRPKDGQASEELADKLNGKFRADWEESSGKEAGDTAFDNAVKGGMGCWRLDTEWEDEYDLDNESQRIRFKPVFDPERTVFFDPDSKEYDRCDAMWAMEMYSMTREAFEEEYPDADTASMGVDSENAQYDWNQPDAIYLARYYEVRIEKVTITRYMNPMTGQTEDYDDDQIKEIKDELEDGEFVIINQRKMKRRRVYCGLMSGAEWLEEPKRIPGEYIPLIPVYGHRTYVDGLERIEGHAGKAMDAQRLENLMVSMIADNATQAGGDNIPIVDVKMIPGPLAMHWGQRNVTRPAYLPMQSLTNKSGDIVAPASVLGYTPTTPLSPALAGLLQYTGGAIQQISGSSQLESLPGNIATDTVDSIFNRMDTQSFIYMDNFAKSMQWCGKVWLSMAREVYGSGRPMRILLEDGTDDMALMNGAVIDRQTGQQVALNDLSVGMYEVTVDVGQSFASRRDSTVRTLTTLLQGIPPQHQYYSLIMGMIIDNIDGEGIDDLKEYNRQQMLLSGAVKPRTPEEKEMVQQAQMAQAQQPDPNMVAAMAQQMLAQAEMLKAQNAAQKNEIEAFKAQSKATVDNSTAALNVAKAQDISNDQVRQALSMLSQYLEKQASNAGDLIR